MKCAEVMEWMHRYLDHDLSQDEMIEMFRHIDNCPSCAEVLDRLSMLSEQLEQLPDVKPPFSLVDSIMPQLDKLEPSVQEPSKGIEKEPNVIPFTRKSTHNKTSKGASMAARTGIGAVAAAVILLIAVLYVPDSMPTADVDNALQRSYDNSAANESMSTAATDTSNSAQGAVPEEAQHEMGAQFTESADNLPVSGDDDSADRAEPAEGEDAPAADSGKRASEAPPVSRKSTPPAKQPVAGQGSKKGIAPPTPGATDMKADSNNTHQGTSIDKGSDTAAGSREALDAGDAPSAGEAGLLSQLPSLVTSQLSWASPDGNYAAELAGGQVAIYRLPAAGFQQERTLLISLPLEGDWVSGYWSADGLEFSYVTMEDGKEVTKVYVVPENLPTDAPAASPEPTPSASASAAHSPDAAPSNK